MRQAATTKLLNKAQNAVLVDGDQAEGSYGNKLKASAGGLFAVSLTRVGSPYPGSGVPPGPRTASGAGT